MTIVAQSQPIDPELAEKVNENGWVYHFRRRAEEAEQAAERWYDEYQRQLHTNEITTYLLSYNRRMRDLYCRIARRIEAELMQGINDLADRAEQAENDLETAYDQIERLQTILENECIWQSSRMALVNLATEERNEAEEQARQLQSDNRDLGDTVLNQGVVIRELTEKLANLSLHAEMLQEFYDPNSDAYTVLNEAKALLEQLEGGNNDND